MDSSSSSFQQMFKAFITILILLPGLAPAQPKRSVLLTANIVQTVDHQIPLPLFKITVQNTGTDTIVAPVKTLLLANQNGTDFIKTTIEAGESYSFEESIYCHNFKRDCTYRVKFSLNSETVDTTAETAWIYFKTPK